jgi:hypothetical protein
MMLWLMILRGRRDLVFPRLNPAGKLEACNTMGRLCPEQADQKKLEQGWLCVSGVLSNLMAYARGLTIALFTSCFVLSTQPHESYHQCH